MGRVPDLKRITKEDFPQEYHGLIDRLGFVLNSHMEQVRNLFNKSIDFTNLDQEIVVLSFLTDNNGQPVSTQTFKSSLNRNINGLIPISVKPQNTQVVVTTFPMINFTQNSNIINLSYIGGLAPETNYTLTLLVI